MAMTFYFYNHFELIFENNEAVKQFLASLAIKFVPKRAFILGFRMI